MKSNWHKFTYGDSFKVYVMKIKGGFICRAIWTDGEKQYQQHMRLDAIARKPILWAANEVIEMHKAGKLTPDWIDGVSDGLIIDDEQLLTLLSDATYGSDWLLIGADKETFKAKKDGYDCRESRWIDCLKQGGYLFATDLFDEDGEVDENGESLGVDHWFCLEDVKKGLLLSIKVAPSDFADLITGRDDAYTGSSLMQCIIFYDYCKKEGDLLYG